MLLDIREKVRNSKPIKYTLITLITIPFALVGIGSYFAGGEIAPAAVVDGVEISARQADQAYGQQRQRLAQMFGGQIPDGFADEQTLRAQAVDQLVTQQVLRNAVAERKLAVSDQQLARSIQELPAFQNDGRFDPEAYENQLRSMGLSVPQFEQSFRDDTAVAQFQAGVIDTAFQLPSERARIDALQRQTRTVDIIQLDLAGAMDEIIVDDAAVAGRFEESADSYQFPQRVKLAYLELDQAGIMDSIEVSDEEARNYYNDNRARYISPELRSASHILIEADRDDEAAVAAASDKLNSLKAELDDGADFAGLAIENSDDVGSADAGGSLGQVAAGAMVPEFEQALYALAEPGSISEPVVSDFGVHLIRLDAVTAESGKPFKEVRDEVVQAIREEQSSREFFELREQLSELSFDNPGSLDAAAEATGLPIVETDWVDQDTQDDTVATNPQVLQAALSEEVLDAGNNSDVIEVGEEHVVVVRVLEHEGPRPKTLEDVREDIRKTLQREQGLEALQARAASISSALEEGQQAAALADAETLATATPDEILTRDTTVFDQVTIDSIYAMAVPGADAPTVQTLTLPEGDLAVVALRSVDVPDLSDDASQDSETGADGAALSASASGAEAGPESAPESGADTVLDPRLGSAEFQALLQSLRGQAEVELGDASAALTADGGG